MEGPYYIVRGGRREGPLTWAQVGALYGAGEVSETSLVWTREMERWGRLGSFLPQAPPAWVAPAREREGGIKRAVFWGIQVGVFLVFSAVAYLYDDILRLSSDVFRGIAVCLYFLIVNLAVVMRLQNIGYNAWLVVLVWVPLAGFHHAAACLYAPEGYARTKQLDRAGRVLFWVAMAAIFAIVTFLLWAGFVFFF